MITSEITDKLKKDVLVIPDKANFGFLRVGGVYEMIVAAINEDILAQRINVKLKKNSNFIKIYSSETGLVKHNFLFLDLIIMGRLHQDWLGKFSSEFTRVRRFSAPITGPSN